MAVDIQRGVTVRAKYEGKSELDRLTRDLKNIPTLANFEPPSLDKFIKEIKASDNELWGATRQAGLLDRQLDGIKDVSISAAIENIPSIERVMNEISGDRDVAFQASLNGGSMIDAQMSKLSRDRDATLQATLNGGSLIDAEVSRLSRDRDVSVKASLLGGSALQTKLDSFTTPLETTLDISAPNLNAIDSQLNNLARPRTAKITAEVSGGVNGGQSMIDSFSGGIANGKSGGLGLAGKAGFSALAAVSGYWAFNEEEKVRYRDIAIGDFARQIDAPIEEVSAVFEALAVLGVDIFAAMDGALETIKKAGELAIDPDFGGLDGIVSEQRQQEYVASVNDGDNLGVFGLVTQDAVEYIKNGETGKAIALADAIGSDNLLNTTQAIARDPQRFDEVRARIVSEGLTTTQADYESARATQQDVNYTHLRALDVSRKVLAEPVRGAKGLFDAAVDVAHNFITSDGKTRGQRIEEYEARTGDTTLTVQGVIADVRDVAAAQQSIFDELNRQLLPQGHMGADWDRANRNMRIERLLPILHSEIKDVNNRKVELPVDENGNIQSDGSPSTELLIKLLEETKRNNELLKQQLEQAEAQNSLTGEQTEVMRRGLDQNLIGFSPI